MPTKKCPFCAEEILESAIKCKHCKSELIHNQSSRTNKIDSTVRGNKVVGVFMGISIACLGLFISATGAGAIIGIPMMILGPIIGFSAIKSNCPYCGNEVSSAGYKKSIKCRACKKISVIKDGKLILVE